MSERGESRWPGGPEMDFEQPKSESHSEGNELEGRDGSERSMVSGILTDWSGANGGEKPEDGVGNNWEHNAYFVAGHPDKPIAIIIKDGQHLSPEEVADLDGQMISGELARSESPSGEQHDAWTLRLESEQ